MRHKILVTLTLATLLFSGSVASAATQTDSLIKGSGPTIYYYANDGLRYVFPNSGTFFSWFKDFSSVKTVSDQELGAIPLKANVTYRPGVRLVKIQTDPKVYAIDKGGVLRWVETEALAAKIYGTDWNKNIDDVSDSFFVNYKLGEPIDSETKYKPESVASDVKTINKDKGITETGSAMVSDTEVGKRSTSASAQSNSTESATSTPSGTIPATPATPSIGEGPATPATPATPGGGQEQPKITSVQVVPAVNSATATWATDMPSDSTVEYGTTASYGHSASSSYETKDHSVEIPGLASGTIYHYQVCSQHNHQSACSDDGTFTTLTPPAPPAPPLQISKFQITNDSHQENGPAIYGKKVVYSDWGGAEVDLRTYDLDTKNDSLLIGGPGDKQSADIWGDNVVWNVTSGTDTDIYGMNLMTSTVFPIAALTGSNQVDPSIYDRNVVWSDNRSGSYQIYVYNLDSKTETRITNDSTDHRVPRIWGDKVVWYNLLGGGFYTIRGYDLTNKSFFDISSTNNGYQQTPDIYNNQVVWLDTSGGTQKVHYKDLSTGVEKIISDGGSSWPKISDQYITWVSDDGVGAHDMYVYDFSTGVTSRVSNDGPEQASPTIPDIYGNTVVWMSWFTGNGDIYGATLSH